MKGQLQQVKWSQDECASQIAYAEREILKAFRWEALVKGRHNVMEEVAACLREIEQAARFGTKNVFAAIGAFYDAQTPESAAVILYHPRNAIYGKRDFVPSVIDDLFNAAEAIEQPGNFTQLEAQERINKMPDAHMLFAALAKHMA